MKGRQWGRVLAIDPTHRGFGFAVLEDSGRLVDWGVKDLSGGRPAAWLKAVRDLVAWYLPDALAVEDCAARESRRGRHARAFTAKVLALAKELKVGRSVCARAMSDSPVPARRTEGAGRHRARGAFPRNCPAGSRPSASPG